MISSKRRSPEHGLSTSLLDLLSCGLGAAILLMLLASRSVSSQTGPKEFASYEMEPSGQQESRWITLTIALYGCDKFKDYGLGSSDSYTSEESLKLLPPFKLWAVDIGSESLIDLKSTTLAGSQALNGPIKKRWDAILLDFKNLSKADANRKTTEFGGKIFHDLLTTPQEITWSAGVKLSAFPKSVDPDWAAFGKHRITMNIPGAKVGKQNVGWRSVTLTMMRRPSKRLHFIFKRNSEVFYPSHRYEQYETTTPFPNGILLSSLTQAGKQRIYFYDLTTLEWGPGNGNSTLSGLENNLIDEGDPGPQVNITMIEIDLGRIWDRNGDVQSGCRSHMFCKRTTRSN